MILLGLLILGCGGAPSAPEPASDVESPPIAPVAPREAPPPPAAPEVAFSLPTEALASPAAVEATPGIEVARERLEAVVRAHALAADNPWAIGHALVALGPDVEASNGEPAVDWLFAEYATLQTVGDDTLVAFPATRGAVRIEPHTDLLLKALTEAGVAPDRAVTVQGRPATVGDLYRHSLYETWTEGPTVWSSSWNDTPWTLQGLAAWAPDDLSWTAEGGREMQLDALTTAVVDRLHRETGFLRDAIARGETVQKRGQGIWDYTCGGAHLLQGAAYAVGRGFGSDGDRERIAAQVPVQFHRLDLELAQVDAALQQRPDLAVVLLEQRLKFLGHFLESVHTLAALGFFTPTDAQQAKLAFATEQLVTTVDVLHRMGVLGKLDVVRQAGEQVYLDYVGDSAHALRGLDLATGEATVAR